MNKAALVCVAVACVGSLAALRASGSVPARGTSAGAPTVHLANALVSGSVSSGAAQRVSANGRVVRVKVFFARGQPGFRCNRVFAVVRTVRAPAVLRGAIAALLRGPTAAERKHGYGGWFSAKTAGKLRSVRLAAGIAYIDFKDLRRIIPNASSSCGSALLLAQLDRTATQFPTVRRAIYSFNANRKAFYEWLQLSPPQD